MRPKNVPPKAPVLVYAHGGAFALSYLPGHLKFAANYAELAKCCVVFVDYRVGAKAVFPMGFDDVFAATEWVLDNADEQGFDSRRVVVGGDSAGGALAASVAQKLTAETSHRLLAQMLIYPVLDSDCKTESAQKFVDTPLWNAQSNRNMWAMYLPGDDSVRSMRYASPMATESYEALPDAYIENAEFDPLRDEARIYAQRLLDAGVSVELNETRQTVHSYDILKESQFSQRAIISRVNFLKCVFEGECPQRYQ